MSNSDPVSGLDLLLCEAPLLHEKVYVLLLVYSSFTTFYYLCATFYYVFILFTIVYYLLNTCCYFRLFCFTAVYYLFLFVFNTLYYFPTKNHKTIIKNKHWIALFELYPRVPSTTIRRDHPIAVLAGKPSKKVRGKSSSGPLLLLLLVRHCENANF